ncbi:MAG TPA: DUF3352 domain-containing protein [Planctomycetaceae bacterium]|jgi:hypothetical protein|nr:DUF3352 domain-containing protein [Planctomycetaceae bacterium]
MRSLTARRITARRMMIPGLALAIAFAALGARGAVAADKAPNDRLLPANTYLYVTVPNVTELKTRFAKTHTGRMLHDPKMADFLGDVHKKLAEISDEVQKHIGVKLTDIFELPDGEVSLAVLLPTDAKKLAVAAIVDFGKSRSTVDTILKSADQALDKAGFKKASRDVEGTQLVVYSKDKDKDKDEKKDSDKSDKPEEPDFGSQVAYAIKGDTLIAASSPAAIQDVLRRWGGKHAETLAEVAGYKAVVELGKHDSAPSVLTWYVNPVTLVQAFVKSSDSVDQSVGMAMAVLPLLGLNNLKAIGGTVHMDTDEYDSVSRILVYVDQPVSGLLSVFHFPAAKQAPPRWVSEDSTAYVAINWDIPKAFSAVEGVIDQFMGPGFTAQKMDEWATDDNGPKIHIKKDVLDNLDGTITVATDSPDAAKPESFRLLVALGVKDQKKAKAALDKVSKMQGIPVKTRDFKGEVIYTLEGIPGFGDSSREMGLTVVQNHLMFSNDVSRLEQVILGDKDRKPLADSEKYQKLAKHFPKETSIQWYQEQESQMKGIYEMLKSGKLAESAAAIPPLAKLLEGIDFKKLPEFDALKKYLPPTASYGVPHANGAEFVSFTLKSAN